MKISWYDLARGGTIAGSPAAATGFPYSNLLASERSLTAKTNATSTTFEVSVTWPAAYQIGVVAVFGLPTSLPASVSVTVSTSADAVNWVAAASTTYTNGVPNNSAFAQLGVALDYKVLWRPADAVSTRGVKIAFSVGLGIIWTASRLWAGQTWDFPRKADYSSVFSKRDTAELVRAADGTARVIPGVVYRSMRLPMSYLTEAQAEQDLSYLHHDNIRLIDRLIIPFWGEGTLRETSEAWIGRIVNDVELSVRPVWAPGGSGPSNYWASVLEFEEV